MKIQGGNIFLTVVILFLQACHLIGADLQVRYITPESGLNNGAINDIVQDPEGLIWLATWDGIIRYDGYSFRNYKPDVVNRSSLQARQVHRLCLDHRGHLLAISYWGVSRYNPCLDRFERIPVEDVGSEYFLPFMASDILSAGERIYLKTPQDLLIMQGEESESPVFQLLDTGDLPPASGYDIVTVNDRLWIVYRRPDMGRTDFFSTELDEGDQGLILQWEFSLQGQAGHVIQADENNLILSLDRKVGMIGLEGSGKGFETLIADVEVQKMLLTSNNQLWFIMPSRGVGSLDMHSGKQEYFLYNNKERELLMGDNINSMFEDFSGNLWIGHAGQGLSVANLRQKNFRTYRHNPVDPTSLSGNSVMCFQECSDGMLVGTDYNGLSWFHPDPRTGDMIFERINFPESFIRTAAYESIWNFAREGSDRYWMASNFGLIESVQNGRNWTHRQHVIFNNPGLRLRKLVLDENGNLWIGTHHAGLILIPANQRESMTQHYYLPVEGNRSSISDDVITEILIDSRDRMWIGTRDQGINRLSQPYSTLNLSSQVKPEMNFLNYRAGHSGNSLNNNEINCLFEYYDGTIWAGTQGGGINILDPETGGISYITENDGLPSNNVFGILSDDQGNLWLSTSKGICSISTYESERKIVCYEPSDGIQGNVFMINSFFKDSHDILYFGGRRGFTSFLPSQIQANSIPPRIVFTDLNIFGEKVEVNDGGSNRKKLSKVLNATDTLVLSYKDYSFRIGVAALHFQNPVENRIEYMLEGFDRGWIRLPAGENNINFSNLNPGKYLLKVRASNSDDIWSNEIRELQLIITPPWYSTWYGYSLFIILGASIVIGLFQLILRQQILRHKISLDAIQMENMKELNETKLRFFTNISHELRTPLNLVLAPIEYLYKFKETPQAVKEQLALSLRNGKLLKRLINNIIEFRKYEANKVQLQYQRSDLADFIKQVGRNFETLKPNTDIQMLYHLYDEPVLCDFDPAKLEQVLYNLLSNAFKYTPDKGTILITLERSLEKEKGIPVEYMHVSVFNEGKNIPGDHLEKIFERFFHDTKGGEGSGIGLSVAKALVELHKGTIQVKNIQDSGVEFRFSLPRFSDLSNLIAGDGGIPVMEEALGMPPLLSVVRDAGESETGETERPRVLIIEDNAELRSFYRTILTGSYQFFEASDGDEGLEMIDEADPDLIISDVMMPGKDGIEVCKTIKEGLSTSHIPVILLTAKGAPDQIVNGYNAGADAYIVKPFETEVLLSQIQGLLKNRERIREKYTSSNAFMDHLPMEPKSKDDFFMKTLNTELEENLFNEDYNVVSLSRKLNISRNHLYRKVKALTGYSTVEYIRVYKLNKAAELLKTQKYSIKEVCYKTGFKDQSYFTKSFKNHFNQNPTEFIKSFLKAQ